MTVTPLPFRGMTFFRDVRDRMQADHGMFVGSDGDFPSVSVDPAFYRIGVFARPANQTFLVSTAAADPKLRTIANVQFFPIYHHISPRRVPWQAKSSCRLGPRRPALAVPQNKK
jgi:hypothetical protein